VIRGSNAVVECSGAPTVEARPARRAAVNSAFAEGTHIGKRWDAANTVELLCVKAGQGSLSIGGVALQLKDVKPRCLPPTEGPP
jgi:hypothetical protein